MVVQGHEVTQAQDNAGREVMKTPPFRARDVTAALVAAGVPETDYIANRVADALLQRERRRGLIVSSTGGWWSKAVGVT